LEKIIVPGKMEIPEELKTTLLENMGENPYLKLGEKFCSYYLVNKHIQKSPAFKYIEPQEIKIPDSDKKFEYVSIIDTISLIVNDPGFKQDEPQVDGFFRDVKDGAAYKQNAFFSANPDAFALIMYSDGLELCNALGASKTIHKIVNIYFTLAELPKHCRSKAENIFLAISVNEKVLKEFRQEVYSPLLTDLQKLEKGVIVDGKIIKVVFEIV
jgi:hypothetical protein